MNKLIAITAVLFFHCHNLNAAQVKSEQELVFIDIWSEYTAPSALPKSDATRQYLQPDLNVSQSDIDKFVITYTRYSNLKIDRNNELALKYGVRSTPAIVKIKHGKMVEKISLSAQLPLPDKEHKPIKKQHLKLQDLSGKQYDFNQAHNARLILFADALCPAQHLPMCEQKAKQHETLSIPSSIAKLTVIKPFYVSKDMVHSYQQRFASQHPVLFDAHNALFRRYKVTGLPYWLLLSKDNQILYRGEQPPSNSVFKQFTNSYSNTHSD
ncbi:hypothetical protein PA25_32360 [Pseudoalteromonas sp. A25]|uniref:thioredoxin family protein n=1 Tax=Pseudoalteromonas sp. A25 TaxID=116092 RepID=UPI0012609E17|nr:thioredoxin family protein [Pseudoalteromonas sp. A25]BBN83251.1 hypothetical protein PA25_32360 [Pseudoalteromonas sp. A25]